MIFLGGKTWLFSDFFLWQTTKSQRRILLLTRDREKFFDILQKLFSEPQRAFLFFCFSRLWSSGASFVCTGKVMFLNWAEMGRGVSLRLSVSSSVFFFSAFLFHLCYNNKPTKGCRFPGKEKERKMVFFISPRFMLFCKWGHGKKVYERELPEQEIVRNRGRQTGKGLNYKQPIFYLDLDNYQFGKKWYPDITTSILPERTSLRGHKWRQDFVFFFLPPAVIFPDSPHFPTYYCSFFLLLRAQRGKKKSKSRKSLFPSCVFFLFRRRRSLIQQRGEIRQNSKTSVPPMTTCLL